MNERKPRFRSSLTLEATKQLYEMADKNDITNLTRYVCSIISKEYNNMKMGMTDSERLRISDDILTQIEQTVIQHLQTSFELKPKKRQGEKHKD